MPSGGSAYNLFNRNYEPLALFGSSPISGDKPPAARLIRTATRRPELLTRTSFSFSFPRPQRHRFSFFARSCAPHIPYSQARASSAQPSTSLPRRKASALR